MGLQTFASDFFCWEDLGTLSVIYGDSFYGDFHAEVNALFEDISVCLRHCQAHRNSSMWILRHWHVGFEANWNGSRHRRRVSEVVHVPTNDEVIVNAEMDHRVEHKGTTHDLQRKVISTLRSGIVGWLDYRHVDLVGLLRTFWNFLKLRKLCNPLDIVLSDCPTEKKAGEFENNHHYYKYEPYDEVANSKHAQPTHAWNFGLHNCKDNEMEHAEDKVGQDSEHCNLHVLHCPLSWQKHVLQMHMEFFTLEIIVLQIVAVFR